MWCPSSDTPIHGHTQAHHRIVRMPPGESVVLNSAERAPYLLLVEILSDDLDFQPNKRSNKELLKQLVVKEDERKPSSDLNSFTRSFDSQRQGRQASAQELEVLSGSISSEPPIPSMDIHPPASPHDDEEMDLVEQLYGPESSLLSRMFDMSDSVVLPPPPKNKELDMAAWSRSSSIPSTPAIENIPPSAGLPSLFAKPLAVQPVPFSTSLAGGDSPHMKEVFPLLSLDDYSERMRTAAIMLAQLNANLREIVTPAVQPSPKVQQQPSLANWLPGSRLGDADSAATKSTISDYPMQRMKLQQSEASAIRDRIMQEMLALEEQRTQRMRENHEDDKIRLEISGSAKSAEDEDIIRRELNKADPSAIVFSESWAAKKVKSTFCRFWK